MENKKIKQAHLGQGDNVGGDKFVMGARDTQKKKKWTIYRVAAWAGILSLVFYLFFSFININKDQTSFNSGDNVTGDKKTEQTHYGSGDNVAGDKFELKIDTAPPQITDIQRELILKKLRSFPPYSDEIEISYKSGNETGESLLYQIESIFLEAGWIIQKASCFNCNNFDGIGVIIGDASQIPPAAKDAFEALSVADLPFPVRYVVDPRDNNRPFRIGIGKF